MGGWGRSDPLERRANELRIPFVRRCRLEFDDGRAGTAFLVNINLQGAYVARDDLYGIAGSWKRNASAEVPQDEMPRVGQAVCCRFQLPGRHDEVEVRGTVSWINPRQQHPVHGLPPGFGIRFDALAGPERAAIAALMDDYLAREPGGAA